MTFIPNVNFILPVSFCTIFTHRFQSTAGSNPCVFQNAKVWWSGAGID